MRRSLVLTLLAAGGCAGPAAWLPATHDTGTLPAIGLPAAVYPLAGGEVRIAALGVRRAPAPRRNELVVRMWIRNDSSCPWRVDLRAQRAVLPGDREIAPDLGYSAGEPLVDVPARGARSIDLVYPIADDKPGHFDLGWALATPRDLVARRTPFEREDLGRASAYPLMVDGWFYAPPYYAGRRHGFAPIAQVRPEHSRVRGRGVRILPLRPPIEIAAPEPSVTP